MHAPADVPALKLSSEVPAVPSAVPSPAPPVQIVGNIGLFYASYRLSRLGWNAMPTTRNARGIDVICFSMDGKRIVTIQVKSLSKLNPVPLGNDLGKIMGDYWIIVAAANSDRPQCFVLKPDEVRDAAHRREKNGKVSFWLQPKQYATDVFRERWDRIGHGQP